METEESIVRGLPRLTGAIFLGMLSMTGLEGLSSYLPFWRYSTKAADIFAIGALLYITIGMYMVSKKRTNWLFNPVVSGFVIAVLMDTTVITRSVGNAANQMRIYTAMVMLLISFVFLIIAKVRYRDTPIVGHIALLVGVLLCWYMLDNPWAVMRFLSRAAQWIASIGR